MILKIKHFVTFTTLTLVLACNESPKALDSITGLQIAIKDSLPETDTILQLVAPYRNHINKKLDSTLAYAPGLISKEDGKYNTTAGNLLADIVFKQSNPIYKSRTGKNIDFVLLNHGGIRSVISKGAITERTAYEVMPFENTVAVVSLNGSSILELVSYLIKSNRPHPISQLQIILNAEGDLSAININGIPFDDTKTYNVATSNYLVSGGDNMVFFKDGLGVTEIEYTIRNTMIDYFKKVDTVAPKVDERFIRLTE